MSNANITNAEDVLAALDHLALRMLQTLRPDVEALREADRERQRGIFRTMASEEATYGEAAGGPLAFLNGPDGQSRLASMDQDLAAQLRVVSESFDHYLRVGEIPAPYYPYRVCVLLRKLKERKRETAFLRSWCQHFGDIDTGRYGALVKRARKAGAI